MLPVLPGRGPADSQVSRHQDWEESLLHMVPCPRSTYPSLSPRKGWEESQSSKKSVHFTEQMTAEPTGKRNAMGLQRALGLPQAPAHKRHLVSLIVACCLLQFYVLWGRGCHTWLYSWGRDHNWQCSGAADMWRCWSNPASHVQGKA